MNDREFEILNTLTNMKETPPLNEPLCSLKKTHNSLQFLLQITSNIQHLNYISIHKYSLLGNRI